MHHLKRNIAGFAAAAAIVASIGFVGAQSAAAETAAPYTAVASAQTVPFTGSSTHAVPGAQQVESAAVREPESAVHVTAAAPDSTSGHLSIGSPTPGGYVTSPAWVAVGAGIFLLIVWSVSIYGYRRFH